MIEADLPENEDARLLALHKINILDTPIEERFERITRILCNALNVPIAAISLIDDKRQWFKSIQGINAAETPRSIAFCAHAILKDEILVVNDATKDDRFSKNPLVTESPSIRFYAGQPLSLDQNIRLGTLCAIDNKPRELSPAESELMRDLASIVESELALVALSEAQTKLIEELDHAHRELKIDPLTRLWNRSGIENLIKREWDFAKRKKFSLGVAMVNFDNFKTINDTHGYPVGDEIIRAGARMLLSSLRSHDAVGRWGGDEFIIIIPGCSHGELFLCLKKIQRTFGNHPVFTSVGPIPLSLSLGATSIIPYDASTIDDFIKKANDALSTAKKKGKGNIEIST